MSIEAKVMAGIRDALEVALWDAPSMEDIDALEILESAEAAEVTVIIVNGKRFRLALVEDAA